MSPRYARRRGRGRGARRLESGDLAITSLLDGVVTIEELRARAAAEGVELPVSVKRLHRWIDRALRDAHRDELRRLVASEPPAVAALPCVAFEAAGTGAGTGTRWHLYGIAHGQRRYLRAGSEVRAQVQAIARLHRPPTTLVALERGMGKVLDVDPALELHTRAADVFTSEPPRAVLRLVAMLVVAPFVAPFMRMSRDPVLRIMRRALRDPRWLASLAEALVLTQPPAPLHMALRRETSGVVHVLHSEAQARCALQLAREHEGEAGEAEGVADVHLVVGLAHVPDLVCLLQSSPDAS